MSDKKDDNAHLVGFLRQRLSKIDGARLLNLCTLDGNELLTVTLDPSEGLTLPAMESEDAQVVAPYTSSIAPSAEHVAKLGFGSQLYSVTWVDHSILVHVKLEAAGMSICLNESANLGLLDEHIALLRKSLQPFTSTNFLGSVL